MGTEKTADHQPADETKAPVASKPLAVQMMDCVVDNAAALATAIVTAGVVKADEAVNKAREVVAAVDERAKAATKPLERKTAVRKPMRKKASAKKTVKEKLAKKTASKKAVKKNALTRKVSRKQAAKPRG